jgi:ABC-2 type transport system ATP-binding protein
MNALTADGLTRRFGDLVAVKHLTFEVPDGVVVGFVGPNGSGKSTTIRVLLGLIEASGGTGTVLGESIEHPERFADRVGALIESPAFVGSLSGRDNLRSLAALRGLPGKRINEVLEIVGLVGREGDKASTYSLGMKQRLGIAAALLPDPEMLVLDEPANGLDPAGIVEIRDLLRSRATDGRTPTSCRRRRIPGAIVGKSGPRSARVGQAAYARKGRPRHCALTVDTSSPSG